MVKNKVWYGANFKQFVLKEANGGRNEATKPDNSSSGNLNMITECDILFEKNSYKKK